MIFEKFKIALALLGCKIFENAFGQFILNCPVKHVITSTNELQQNDNRMITKIINNSFYHSILSSTVNIL